MNILEPYKQLFLTHLEKEFTPRDPKNLYEPINYILQIGGKRLRPLLAMMLCEVYGSNPKKAIDAALAVEVFHNFTLVHDDVMDHAPVRRGKPTVHKKWNLNTAILSGDAMMIRSYQFLEGYEGELNKQLVSLFSKTALEVCEGQQLDIDFETKDDVTIEEYIHMITYKTSVLVAASMQMGAMIANVSPEEAQKVYKFGLNLGIAFQLQDDYLDTFGDAKTFGKKIGGDILENKKTLLYLKALEKADENTQKKLLVWFKTNAQSDNKIKEVTDIFRQLKIDEIMKDEIARFNKKAMDCLNQLNISEEKATMLREFSDQLSVRVV